jgi:uncharacterized RDD family membrane protein YckC
VCMSVTGHIFPVFINVTFFVSHYFWPIEAAPLLGLKMFCGHYFIFGSGGTVCTRWVGLQVIAENMKIYSPIHVAKNRYPQDMS